MELFIRIKDGKPFEHPIFGDNFRQAFPDIDVNNLPPEFAKFQRYGPPSNLGPYEVYEGVTYEWEGNIVRDVHHIKELSEEEKISKQNFVKEQWVLGNNYKSWIFNEDTCTFNPPVAYPIDGKKYVWDEETISWVEYKPEITDIEE
jgi:hypothetical protein